MALVVCCVGVLLAHHIDPAVGVERVTLGQGTPALRFRPSTPGPHPTVLLAHGVSASKETLFRLGEALAVNGFECFAIDLPGHGESPRPFLVGDNAATIREAAANIGSVDVFVGHSMGAYAGAQSVREGGLHPRLFIALGALPDVAPPLLLLAGRFEEAVSPERLRARTEARLVLSAWSDHALEPYDPELVDSAVQAACSAVGKTAAEPTRCWVWRLGGGVLAILGALGLGFLMPRLHPLLKAQHGVLLSVVTLVAFVASSGTWVGAMTTPRRAPVQLVAMGLVGLALIGTRRLGLPRWSLGASLLVVALGLSLTGASFHGLFVLLLALLWLTGAGLAAMADSQGDVACAIFVGYAIGQWIPVLY